MQFAMQEEEKNISTRTMKITVNPGGNEDISVVRNKAIMLKGILEIILSPDCYEFSKLEWDPIGSDKIRYRFTLKYPTHDKKKIEETVVDEAEKANSFAFKII